MSSTLYWSEVLAQRRRKTVGGLGVIDPISDSSTQSQRLLTWQLETEKFFSPIQLEAKGVMCVPYRMFWMVM